MIYLALWLLDVYVGAVHSIVFTTIASIAVTGGFYVGYSVTYTDAMSFKKNGYTGWGEDAYNFNQLVGGWLRPLRWVALTLAVVALLMPSERTVKLMVGVYAVEQVSSEVAKRPEFDKLVKATNKFLDDYLEEKPTVGSNSK